MDTKYLLTISGKSLSGKTTLGRLLESTGDFQEIVSHTTRPRRPGENYGADYYFVTDDAFSCMMVNYELIGGTMVDGYMYGTSYRELERVTASDKIPFAVTDPEGPKFMKPWCEDNDVTLIALWRHVDKPSQFRRWYKRTREDESKLDTSIDRLVGMVDREPIWYDQWDWDLILTEQDDMVLLLNQVREAVGLDPLPAEWKAPENILQVA